MSYKEYCMLNSCTDEGLQAIAKYNCYEDDWNEMKKINNSTSMAEKRFTSIMLFAKHRGKCKNHLDLLEGGHCRADIFQANFCS